eukprot:CAMPEP_0181106592 /NCGR_PEP_ID=MMETSP1071-20121207/16614_1 /TAXON_ID=35127 /ORGANISM="Thalassiosira sp., Strain NH16" /LENGTH=641 /DNA_ID=CAMNT_0023190009 /DNA_START=160 /DNA_END=2085 /DNA_ORIENTATION=-
MTTSTNEELANPEISTAEECGTIEHHPIVIVGGGIGGLVLALCLDQVYNHPGEEGDNSLADDDDKGDDDDGCPKTPPPPATTASGPPRKYRLPIHVYESASAYGDNAGGAIGLYSNGLRVLRDLSAAHPEVPDLLSDVRDAGCDYLYRRWMRHDGTEVAVAREDELLPDVENDDDNDDDENEADDGRRYSGESEAADRRSRGGSFRGLRKSFVNLIGVPKNDRASGISTASSSSNMVETELLSLGIRRWKYQRVLYDACLAAGIRIHFGKRLQTAMSMPPGSGDGTEDNDARTMLHFKDGSRITTSLLVGADGINSKARNYVTNPTKMDAGHDEQQHSTAQEGYVPEYTGVTCLMGCANVPRAQRGICFPSSATTMCHACYYPTRVPREDGGDGDPGEDYYEQVFQIYFPSPVERPDTWRTLTEEEAREECGELARRLREDGWDEQFLTALESPTLTGVLRVGLRSREGLDRWHVGGGDISGGEGSDDAAEVLGRAVLLGDAAHPPVPYIGQGAMMAMEDAGTLAKLLGHFCPITAIEQQRQQQDDHNASSTTIIRPNFAQFSNAMSVYESLRVPRTKAILGSSVQLGKTQQKRAESKLYNAWREMSIKAQVWAYGTLPVMRPGAAFDYGVAVEEALLAEG